MKIGGDSSLEIKIKAVDAAMNALAAQMPTQYTLIANVIDAKIALAAAIRGDTVTQPVASWTGA